MSKTTSCFVFEKGNVNFRLSGHAENGSAQFVFDDSGLEYETSDYSGRTIRTVDLCAEDVVELHRWLGEQLK